MTNREIIRLLSNYLIGELSPEELESLKLWLDTDKKNRDFFDSFLTNRSFMERYKTRKGINLEKAIHTFDQQTGGFMVIRKQWRYKWFYAVAVVIVLIAGIKWFQTDPSSTKIPETTVVPGSSKAVLVLANGIQVNLTEQDSLDMKLESGGKLTQQGKQLIYQGSTEKKGKYNELRVPRGGEYEVVFADGTSVHLNSASSLYYPEGFGSERRVKLQGEAFFEVAKSDVPFIVETEDIAIKVYGTSFNVNTHRKEHIQTVLVEGKVGITVNDTGEEHLLSPCQLADFDKRSGKMVIQEVDLLPYIAWTKGDFVFQSERLEMIMETLSLWYDVEVFYTRQEVKDLHFTGVLKRYSDIDIILHALEQSVNVSFNRNGRVLTAN